MQKWNLIVDVAKCTNCSNCLLANKDEHVGNDFPGYAAPQPNLGHRWIDILRKERGQTPMVDVAHLPTMCNHCDNAPCIRPETAGVVKKRADGIVIIDPQKAKGRRDIVDMCPYGSIWWNEELQLPQHWIFDAHLLDQGWTGPRCVTVCPTAAMTSVKLEDLEMASRAKRELLEVLKPELNTKPRVYYKNLARYTTAFIAGSTSARRGSLHDCLEGAIVTLLHDGTAIASQSTDNFGMFKFDGLRADGAQYAVEAAASGYGVQRIDVALHDSIYVGDIVFSTN